MSNLLVDTYTTYRIITTLTKPWNKQEAYEFGIIDENGKVLRKAKDLKTSKEKDNSILKVTENFFGTKVFWKTGLIAFRLSSGAFCRGVSIESSQSLRCLK